MQIKIKTITYLDQIEKKKKNYKTVTSLKIQYVKM